jgi:phosphoribosylformylglycinamidine synthase
MGEACRFFDTPVTGGNVSFYNESPNVAVYPTPTIGMVGLIENLNNITTSFFKDENDFIFVLGEDFEELGGSEYVKVIHGKVTGDSPTINLAVEKNLHNTLLQLINEGLIKSAHDISEGGIAASLAECCIINKEKLIGAEVTIPVKSREDFSIFSESQSRIIISISEGNRNKVEKILEGRNQPFYFAGKTGGENLIFNNKFTFELTQLSDIYYNTISRIMNE